MLKITKRIFNFMWYTYIYESLKQTSMLILLIGTYLTKMGEFSNIINKLTFKDDNDPLRKLCIKYT